MSGSGALFLESGIIPTKPSGARPPLEIKARQRPWQCRGTKGKTSGLTRGETLLWETSLCILPPSVSAPNPDGGEGIPRNRPEMPHNHCDYRVPLETGNLYNQQMTRKLRVGGGCGVLVPQGHQGQRLWGNWAGQTNVCQAGVAAEQGGCQCSSAGGCFH